MKSSRNSGVNVKIKKRLIILFIIISAILVSLLGRVGWIQIVQGEKLKKMAIEQWDSEVEVDAKRGEILGRNGEKLAISASCKRVDVYMPDVRKAEKNRSDIKNEIALKISGILNLNREDILKKLNATLSNGLPVNSITLVRKIDNDKGDGIEKLKLPGIIVSDDTKRFYPNGNFLSQVLGFTNIDGQGQEGIELEYDKELKGIPGTVSMKTDRYGRELPYYSSKYNNPVNGSNITLTIDEVTQLYMEKVLDNAVTENKAKSATAIVMDPKTGEILAMASKPDFNPNTPRDMSGFKTVEEMIESWMNKAVTFTFEPGSVFKLVTATASLSEKIVDDNTRFNDLGFHTVAGRRIYNWNRTGNGVLNFAELLQNSSNVGFMMLGEQLGKDKLYKYIDDFGFTKKTGIDVSFEETGYSVPLNKVGPVELANISFGQGIVVTPIQLTAAYAAIANGGKMMVPHLVKSIEGTGQDGSIISREEIQPKLSRQVTDANTAKKLLEYLETVITVGGGHGAYVEGYRIAGKTGTAQKAEKGKYIEDKYVSSFIGMAPVDDPKFVVYVSVDEPDPEKYYAGQVVAPVAGHLFKDLFVRNNMAPEKKDESGMVVVPNVLRLTQKDAENRLKFSGFKVEVRGSGTSVKSTSPAPGVSVKSGSKVIITMGNPQ